MKGTEGGKVIKEKYIWTKAEGHRARNNLPMSWYGICAWGAMQISLKEQNGRKK